MLFDFIRRGYHCGHQAPFQGIKKPQNARGTRILGFLVVVWAGIEPATQGFSVLCSTD